MTPIQHCLGPICFVPLDANAPRFFGFAEFLTALALMALAWTTADARYRFRVQTAPVPLRGLTFASVVVLGLLTLATDLWRAEHWLVPRGHVITPASWQALLGLLLLATFLLWAWFAFIRPPTFSRRNARRYAEALYRAILNGSPDYLAVVGEELARSAGALIRHAPNRRRGTAEAGTNNQPLPDTAQYANDVLLLIADRRFCRAIVDSAPGTALAIFREIGVTEKYGAPIETFARNIVSEALANRNSFLYHETEGYYTGFMGYQKPLSQAMFANSRMVEAIGSLLDPIYWEMRSWDAARWSAYCRIVIMTFRDHVQQDLWDHSFVLYRAIDHIKKAPSDIYKIDGAAGLDWDSDVQQRLRTVVGFLKDALEILQNRQTPADFVLRIRQKHGARESVYDLIAEAIFEVISAASAVRSPTGLCWWIQHNTVWSEVFHFGNGAGAGPEVVKFKVRRLLYNEIERMNFFPNYKGAKILGFCLNVLGLQERKEEYFADSIALHKAVLSWVRQHFACLHDYDPRLAEACLVEGMSYEPTRLRIVRTYPAEGLRRAPRYEFFEVLPCLLGQAQSPVLAAAAADQPEIERRA